MSDILNPYKSPETVIVPEKPLTVQGTLTETMLFYLKGASPWLRFIGILGFIGTGFAALWGVFYIVAGPFMQQTWNEIPGFEEFSSIGGVFNAFMGVIIVGTSVVVFVPSLFCYRFGEKIRAYFRSGAERELELALKNNKSLWKFYGIVCIVYLAFIPLLIIGGIIAAVAVAIS